VLAIGAQVKAYLAVHSYGQYLLTPWGYTSAYPDDYDDLASFLCFHWKYFIWLFEQLIRRDHGRSRKQNA
jgi:hypothetical protein